jgi:hypothetical protein
LILFCKGAVKIRAGTDFRSLVSVTAITLNFMENNIFLLMYITVPCPFYYLSLVEEIAPEMISFR